MTNAEETAECWSTRAPHGVPVYKLGSAREQLDDTARIDALILMPAALRQLSAEAAAKTQPRQVKVPSQQLDLG
ncbi:hypothetical protein MRX96_028529 [Rhipicephalus microplus]